jgi:beta-glucosidase
MKRKAEPEMIFPKNFLWGAATSAYQIEGAARIDGKGLSVWDMMCRKPGAVWRGQNGDVACDHYRRYKADVALMKEIGLKAYRFSVSWPRVMPNGMGRVNQKGLEFYDKLVDELLASGIRPFLTLFHWDYPYELYLRGGWLNPSSPDWFAEYAAVLSRKLSDRVRDWITHNEPQCFIGDGHRTGVHAPGDKFDWPEVLLAGHNCLLAHGKAVQALRAGSRKKLNIGYAPVGVVKFPVSKKPADIRAARSVMFGVREKSLWNNTWWMDPVFLGRYPNDGLRIFEKEMPRIKAADLKTINQPIDFLGVNIYSGEACQMGKENRMEAVPLAPGHPLTAFYWPVTPEALYWGPKFFQERYKLPVYVTENGMANTDWVAKDGRVHDPQRIDFMASYLKDLGRVIRDGVDVRGYFHWSIMDNFEWAEGFKQRFGLIHVDFTTLKRTLKDSARWYKKIIAENGLGSKE